MSIEDLGSNNGTYVNGQRVQSGILQDQDEIVIANNRIRVELPDTPVKGRSEFDAHVTVMDMQSPSLVRSSEEASDSQRFWHSSAVLAGVQDSLREQRLLERKLSAISSILEIAAQAHDPAQLLDALCGALLDLFPSADSVGVLVEDERTKELKAITHRSRRSNGPVATDIRVPGTIIQHVVQDRRGILLHDGSGAGVIRCRWRPGLAGWARRARRRRRQTAQGWRERGQGGAGRPRSAPARRRAGRRRLHGSRCQGGGRRPAGRVAPVAPSSPPEPLRRHLCREQLARVPRRTSIS